jgi:hypothetical protein
MPCYILDQMGREILCEHCERTLTSKAYHVISEDAEGGILLDMIVCQPCNQKAQELGLKTREFNLDDHLIEDHYIKGGS